MASPSSEFDDAHGPAVGRADPRSGAPGQPTIPADLLAILVCPMPECRAALELQDARLRCQACGRRYRFEDGWPVLIPEEAERPATSG
jgi:uncharacterized protein YbaR (Trm112 family)